MKRTGLVRKLERPDASSSGTEGNTIGIGTRSLAFHSLYLAIGKSRNSSQNTFSENLRSTGVKNPTPLGGLDKLD